MRWGTIFFLVYICVSCTSYRLNKLSSREKDPQKELTKIFEQREIVYSSVAERVILIDNKLFFDSLHYSRSILILAQLSSNNFKYEFHFVNKEGEIESKYSENDYSNLFKLYDQNIDTLTSVPNMDYIEHHRYICISIINKGLNRVFVLHKNQFETDPSHPLTSFVKTAYKEIYSNVSSAPTK